MFEELKEMELIEVDGGCARCSFYISRGYIPVHYDNVIFPW